MAELITDENLNETLNTDKLIVMDVWAPWCGPCRTIGPVIEEIHGEFKDVVVGKINIDDNPNVAATYGIRSIPAIIFIKNGVEVDRIVGAVAKAKIVEKIEAHKG